MLTVEKIIKELQGSRFWGELSLKFQDGHVVHAKKTESLDLPKQPNLNRTERDQHDHDSR